VFEQELADKLKRIFDFQKVTYSLPGETQEQETLFVEVEVPRFKVSDKTVTARITGRAVVFANYDKLPFGYFAKRIAMADLADTKDLFFTEIEENTRVYQNKVQRSFGFIYFFSGQYDPSVGTITSIEIQES
jgi:hypothetical protein